MKKYMLTGILALLCVSQVLDAVPAKRGKFVRIQPDGTAVTLQRHGDEFYHWTTTEDGTVVAPDADGFYRPASMPVGEQLGGRAASMQAAATIRARRMASKSILKASGSSTYTTYRFPVFLVQFSDVQFSSETANDDFTRLLNEEGYSDNGGTGSVHDFYWENSMETFYAVFDVYGPYTYDGTCADNADENDAATILWSAIKEHNSDVDWSQYDNDGDGTVDMVFMYYAGWNEAEGEENTIWPHKYNFSYAGASTSRLDGVSFDVYACTSELKGTSSSSGGMCGIGTCAHEFSHTQGLPDFYDVNYDNYGDGEAGGTYVYDIMCSGAYNNEGRTPPYFTAEERIMMGWLDGYESLPSSGEIAIPSVDNNYAYKLETSNTSGDGEYFVFECRSGKGWDAYVEPGLVVYHADKSEKYTVEFYTSSTRSYSYTPYELWDSAQQYINANGDHPCFYIVPAADQDNMCYGGSDTKLPFPGDAGISFYSPADWEGNSYDLFSGISFLSDGSDYDYSGKAVVTMTRGENYNGICGYVKDSSGAGIEGATVSIYAQGSSSSNVIGSSGIQKISGRILDNLKMSVQTDENGYYSIDLSLMDATTVDIEVVSSGHITKYETISVPESLTTKNFTMRGINEPIDYTLEKYTALTDIYGLGYGSTATSYASIHFTAEELSDYVGRKILTLGFAYSTGDSGSVSSVYGIIDFGSSRKLTSKVSSPESGAWNTIDVSGEDLYVPADTDCYFGYALVNCTYGYPMLFSDEDAADGGFNYCITESSSVSSSSTWYEISGYGNLLIYVELDDSSEVDYNYIYNPGYGTYTVGDSFALTLVEAAGDRKPGSEIVWYFDDEQVATSSEAASGEAVTLKYAGYHVVEARFTTTDGKTKVVELELNVGL